MNTITILKKQLSTAFIMVQNMIHNTPDSIWNQKKGGYVYWQQIVHAITGSLYWLRTDNSQFTEPYSELMIYPELEKDPENELTKQQVLNLLDQAIQLAEVFFHHIDENRLLESSKIYEKTTNLAVVLGQIAHLNYHIGHCESILRDKGVSNIKWIENFDD